MMASMKKIFKRTLFASCVSFLLLCIYESYAESIISKLPVAQPILAKLLPLLNDLSDQDFFQEFFEENRDIIKVNPNDEAQSKKVIISFERMALTQSFIDLINARLPIEKIKLEIFGKGLEEDLRYLKSFKEKLPTDAGIAAYGALSALTKLKMEVRKEYEERTDILSAFQKLIGTKVGKLLLMRILIAIKKIDTSPGDSRYPRIVIGYGGRVFCLAQR
jgi:hypothetical protein